MAIEKYSYLIGQKINKWTVIEFDREKKPFSVLCECECGTKKLVGVGNLVNSRSKDCGCGRKKTMSNIKGKNLCGHRFGKLTVMEMLPETDRNHRRVYRCKCDCGRETILCSCSLVTGHSLSCGCVLSHWNFFIDELLKNKEIEHQCEYRIEYEGKSFRFDFYLPQYNLFIEYDGSQHYMPINRTKDQEVNQKQFEGVQERDQMKNKYCEENHINLLRIPYWETKNIETIINNHLQRLNDKDITEYVVYATV